MRIDFGYELIESSVDHYASSEAEAVTTPIGHIPVKSSLDLTGLEISDADMKALLEVDRSAWHEDVTDQRKFFEQFGDHLPHEILTEVDALEYRLKRF
jgi:phosphoenolpyruvate carboxykinase (GTP)